MRSLLGTASSRWLLCLIGVAAMFFLLAAAIPGPWHHDGAHQQCSACHVGQQFALAALAAILLAPTLVMFAAIPLPAAQWTPRFARNARSPRAPPA